jgi:D-inositol-3-phosphate glycosyltransferase
MAKKNVAIFTSAARGLAHYVAHLYGPLQKRANLFYVTFDGQEVDPLVKEQVPRVYQIIRDQSASSILEAIRFLKNKKIDLINLHVSDTVRRMYLQYFAMMSYARNLGIPVCLTIHDVFTIEALDLDPAVVELIYSLGDSNIVGNYSERDKLEFYFNVPEKKIVVVSHGPYNLFDKHRYSKDQAKKALGLKGKKVILFFGQIRPNKGLKHLIKAFPLILKEHKDAMLYISTDLHLSTPELNEYLRRLERSGVSEKIKLVKDYIPSDEVERVFKAADVVALPYTQVSQSGVLNLALAFKKPVVVSDAFFEATRINGKAGYSFRAGDYKALAAALSRVLSLKDIGVSLGERGYKVALASTDWNRAAERTMRAYRVALRKARKR